METVFIVDDDPDHRDYVRYVLEHEGYITKDFKNGRECLAHLDRKRPDLIVTDIFMPEVDGIELISTIRKRGFNVPVVGMTGGFSSHDMPNEKISALLAFSNVLSKPFDSVKLKETVSTTLNDPSSTTAET